MQLHRTCIAVLLAVALAILPLAGCGKDAPGQGSQAGSKGTAAMGRYIEEQWEFPIPGVVNVSASHLRGDGRIAMIMNTREAVQRYFTTTDGSDWQEETPAWLAALKKEADFVAAIHFNSKGVGAALYYPKDAPEEDYSQKVALIGADGSVTSVPIGENGSPWTYGNHSEPFMLFLYDLQVGEDGNLYLFGYGNSGCFDPVTGECLFEYLEGGSSLILAGGEVAQLMMKYTADQIGNIALKSDSLLFTDSMGGGQRIVSADPLQPSRWGGATFATQADGTLYAANRAGLFRLATGGETWERLLDGELSSLSLPTTEVRSLFPHSDNQFLTLTDGDSPQLINYVYSADTPSRPDTELTIYSMIQNNTLYQAMGVFRKSHPDVLVSIRSTNDEDSSYTGDDARAAINTELLAGKGPDILLLHGFPMESFMEKGVFIDLTPTIQPLIDSGEVLAGVVKSLERDGKLYTVPTRFSMPTIWGDKETIAAAGSLTALADYAQANPGKRIFSNLAPDPLLFTLGRACQNSFLTGDGQVDVDAVARFYTDVKRIVDNEGDTPYLIEEAEPFNERYFQNADGEDSDGMYAVAYSQAALMTGSLNGFSSVMIPNGAVYARLVGPPDEKNGISTVPDSEVNEVFRLMPGTETGVFYPSSIVGVNANSRQQELAAEFVAAMLGQETQSADLYQGGLPVNRAAIAYNVAREEDRWAGHSYVDDNGQEVQVVEMVWPSHAMLQAVADHFDSLATPVLDNEELMEVVIESGRAYFDGSATALEAAEQVRRETRLRLAE